MATYMELCNLVLKQLNEVEFQQSSFGDATGFHAEVKDSVNFALADIAQSEIEWPFTLVHITKTATAEINFIAFENDLQRVDWQSFHMGNLYILLRY